MGIRSFRQGEAYFDRFARTRDGGFGTASDSVSATGGTKFNSGNYTYHFYVNDAFGPQPQPNKEFTLASGSSINVLVIGGGAGGQNDGGGGGGAGGVAHAENMPVSPGTFVATVGAPSMYTVEAFVVVAPPEVIVGVATCKALIFVCVPLDASVTEPLTFNIS